MKYDCLKEFKNEEFRRLTGVKRATFEKMVGILKEAESSKKRFGGRPNDRPHSGKYCYGKTLLETFKSSKHLAIEKNNEIIYNQEVADSKEKSDEILLNTILKQVSVRLNFDLYNYEKFVEFKTATLNFFKNISIFKEELKILFYKKFHIINP